MLCKPSVTIADANSIPLPASLTEINTLAEFMLASKLTVFKIPLVARNVLEALPVDRLNAWLTIDASPVRVQHCRPLSKFQLGTASGVAHRSTASVLVTVGKGTGVLVALGAVVGLD